MSPQGAVSALQGLPRIGRDHAAIDRRRAAERLDHGPQAGPITANPRYVPGICRHPQNFEGSFRELRGNLKLAV